jgi:hypothetical protein
MGEKKTSKGPFMVGVTPPPSLNNHRNIYNFFITYQKKEIT